MVALVIVTAHIAQASDDNVSYRVTWSELGVVVVSVAEWTVTTTRVVVAAAAVVVAVAIILGACCVAPSPGLCEGGVVSTTYFCEGAAPLGVSGGRGSTGRRWGMCPTDDLPCIYSVHASHQQMMTTDRRRHVIPKGQGSDPKISEALWLHNHAGWIIIDHKQENTTLATKHQI